MKKITVIVPSLDPDEKLMKVIEELEKEGFDDIIVVNDGSHEEKLCNFPDPAEHPSCTVLTHPFNRGKGAALKTAFTYFLENRGDRLGVVTVDGDNQHLPKDVRACAEKMVETKDLVLGVRDFSLSHVPKRSRYGNRITSFVFRLCCGMKISDTQTGLRAFPKEILHAMCEISGDRFEYETNMLLGLREYGIKISEQPIETVYIEENQTSHFRPVRDSIRVYSLILKFIASSVISSVIDNLVFFLALTLLGAKFGVQTRLICFIIARAISSVTNFIINKKTVFKNSDNIPKTIAKYYALAIPMLLIAEVGVGVIVKNFGEAFLGISASVFTTAVKIVIELILFVLSFRIQREWVFSSKKKK
ncbi:MAG: bifunctional glycosyltransferase family 2/GtrA family protein [Clostridia bacterium]|nr:bifunctional glycosyltransferase family 2/GtrA family protein [Clostridia bacterium]